MYYIDSTSFYRCVHLRLPRQFSARILRGRCNYFHSIVRRCEGWSMIWRQMVALCSVAWPIDLCCQCRRDPRLQLSSIGLRLPNLPRGKPKFSNLTAVFGRPLKSVRRRIHVLLVATIAIPFGFALLDRACLMIKLAIQARNPSQRHIATNLSLSAVKTSLACASSRHRVCQREPVVVR